MDDLFQKYLKQNEEIGQVESSGYPLVYVKGLPTVHSYEMVLFETGHYGQVLTIDRAKVEILLFTTEQISLGTRVVRTGSFLDVPVGVELLGNSINPLGSALYENVQLSSPSEKYDVERPAQVLANRLEIKRPLLTGLSIVDLMVPLGMGQREIILGDRKTGRSQFSLQVVLNQLKHSDNTIGIYACIGKKKDDIRKVENYFKKHNVFDRTVVVASTAEDPLAFIHQTPYVAMSISEYFSDQGKDVILILDDLTTHAKYFRELSLLAKKFPGRSSYPGDIFYTHSRLIERAGSFNTGGTITLLPVVDTVEGDISGYIQTNIMSMTDGHLFFNTDLFYKGQRPAVDMYYSVTRLGRQTQSKMRWSINRELNSFFALFQRTQGFVHFGAELNEGIHSTLSMGDKLLKFFSQPVDIVLPINTQILVFCFLWAGLWNSKTVDEIPELITNVTNEYNANNDFHNLINDIIDNSIDLNELLSKFMPKVQNYKYLFK